MNSKIARFINKKLCERFLQLFAGLHEMFTKPPWSKLLFNITIKCHMLLHSILKARHMHPHKSWCYSGEDLMHRTRIVCRSCVIGVKI